MITKITKDMATSIAPLKSKAKASNSVRFSSAKSSVDPGLYVSHVIVVSTIPDNALLRKLRVLHPTKFWIFSPTGKNSMLVCYLATPRQQLYLYCVSEGFGNNLHSRGTASIF